MITGWHVEQAAEDTLRAWLPATLAHAATEHGLDCADLSVPRDGSWHRMVSEDDLLREDQIPAVAIFAGGSSFTGPTDGEWEGTFSLAVTALVRETSHELTARVAHVYQAAVLAVLAWQRSLGGFADGTWPTVGEIRPAFADSSRTLLAARVTALVRVSAVLPGQSPWDTPPADPCAPLPPTGLVQSTHISIDRMEG